MTYIRKSVSVTLIIAMMLVFMFSNVQASPRLIYQTSTKETITSGAVLEKITRFTDDGWLNINVLRVNLFDPNVKIDTVYNTDSMQKLTSTKVLAESSGAVAAVNTGFFTWSDKPGLGYPIGPVMTSGELVSTSSDFNQDKDYLATFSVSQLNEIMVDYWKTDIQMITPSGNSVGVGRYNKAYYGNRDYTIWDRKWSKTSPGIENGAKDIVEMVVDNGKVVEIREAQPGVEIPVNGFVVVTRKEGRDFLYENFNPGDEVKLSITTNPDWTKLKMATSGGAILLKDGNIPGKFSHVPEDTTGGRSTRQPRTAIGGTENGKEVMLVTVDGRQNNSIGVTLTELAQIMKELGASNALNFDGGGSTTMVARIPGTSNLDIINNPSDGSPRKIATALGVFSIAPKSELDGLIIDANDTNAFVNTSRAFTVKGFDRYFNPVEVKPEDIKWSVSGIKGTFKDNVFYPTTVGTGKIKATIGQVSAVLEFNSLSSPVQLILSDKSISLSKDKTKSLTIQGKNLNGYYANISPSDVKWTVKNNLGAVDSNGVFTPGAQGTGYIDAAVGKTHAYCALAIKIEKNTILNSFEKANGTFTSYPTTITGSYELSGEQKHSGKMSGKLTYDLSNTSEKRAAYVVFDKDGYTLNPKTEKIGMWVYNDHENSNWLGAWVYDSKNVQHLVYFTKAMDWTGWKYVEASLDGISSPAKLKRLYLVQINPVSELGTIYFDDVSAVTSSMPAIDLSKIPQDAVPADAANKSVTYKKASDSFRFAVFGQSHEPKNSLEKLLLSKLTTKVNSFVDASAIVGGSQHAFAKSIKKNSLATNTGYKSINMVNSSLIQLDMSKQGLRKSNVEQWHWFLDQLNSAKGSNVFIFLAGAPQSFSDSQEAKVFQDILTTYKQDSRKNVWVFYKGDKNGSYMERGIKYITTAGYEVSGLTPDKTSLAKYLLVTVKGSKVTFEFKPII